MCGRGLWMIGAGKYGLSSVRHGLPSLLLLVLAAASLAWLLELSAALSEFATSCSFAVQTWFFSTETGRSDLLVARGYIRGVRYHLGTLAWGSLLIPLARFPRMAAACCGACEGSRDGPCVDLGPVALPAQAPEAQAPAAAGPPGARPRGGLHRLHRRAYVDTAHGGRAFCEASARAAEVMALAGGLEGVMLICKGAGVGAIATAGAALTYACCRSLPMYSGPERAEYVQDPMFLATASAVASFVLALPLAGVFDKVVDTIVYCAAVGDSPSGGAAQLEAGLRHALELRGRSGDL
ncbi:unnamed protein product [Prorocentrum cordatum]|uniref:Choline transporter-like protein n=1 Tax=Prorocentrum cordatum TaxID=2364126 RepID=A0ABN9TYH6_9DINO|nr:unnamed protein product [Polarella glacialis]